MEEFRDIIGYEGIYQVSNMGRVKSLKFNKEKFLRNRVNSNGYLFVSLSTDGKIKQIGIHQLVAMAFLDHIPSGMKLVVDHINDIKTDNRLENLQIITQRENAYKTQSNYSSQYKGVIWDKGSNKWRARIDVNGKTIHLGRFNCELEAYKSYQNKLKTL